MKNSSFYISLGKSREKYKPVSLKFGLLKISFTHDLYKGVVCGELKVQESANAATVGRPPV